MIWFKSLSNWYCFYAWQWQLLEGAIVLVKTKLRNKMGFSLLDDCLVTFLKWDIFFEDDIHKAFMSLRKRRIKQSEK